MEKEKFDKKKYDNEYIKKNKDRINFVMPKGRKAEIIQHAQSAGMTASEWINEAIKEKMTGGVSLDIPDMEIYAKSAKMTVEEYIKQSVIEKMQRQDKNFTEEMTREKIDF